MIRSLRGAVAAVCLGRAAVAATLFSSEDYAPAAMRGAYLLRDGGARAASLGGAFTAIADEPASLATNAGGVGQLAGFGVSVAYDGAGHGFGVSEIAAAKPQFGGVLAARFALMSYGEYDARDAAGVSLGDVGVRDVSAAIGYARPTPEWLGPRGTWGLAMSGSSETAGELMIIGLHLGWLGHLSNAWSVGLAVRNLAPLPEGKAPMLIAAGGAYTFGDRLARASLDAGYGAGDGQARVSVGLEMPALARPGEAGHKSPLAIRIGYRGELLARNRGGADGISAGLGFRKGRFQVDFAFQSYGELGGGVRAGVAYQVRPEVLSAR